MKIHVEVYIASQILGRSKDIFTFQELYKFIRMVFHDSRAGIYTHICAECVANAPQNFALGHNYLWRIDRGIYRVFKPGFDQPSQGREKCIYRPKREDLPENFLYLLVD